MSWEEAKELLLLWAITGMLGAIVWMAREMLSEFRRLRESVEALNVKIAVVITDLQHHEERITRLEDKK
jgi:hypothetical protein